MSDFEAISPTPEEILKRLEKIAPHLGFLIVPPHELTADSFAPYTSPESKVEVASALNELFPKAEWAEQDFNVLDTLSSCSGPFIELGGPSPRGYRLVDLVKVHGMSGKRILVTNVNRSELQQEIPSILQSVIEIGGFQDATQMNYEDSSVGALFISGIGFYAFPRIAEQSTRVLENNGLLIADYIRNLEVAKALNSGLHLRQYLSEIYSSSTGYQERVWQAIFQKS